MKMLHFKLYMLTLIFFGGISCSEIKKNSADYFPISVGMKLQYNIVQSKADTNVEGKALMKIENTETINGKSYFIITYDYSGIPGLEPETYYTRLAEDGYYSMKKTNNVLSPEYLDVKLPLDAGTNWKSNSPEGEIEYTVQGMENLELMNKKYENCLKLTFKSKEGEGGYMFLAKGIGIIKYYSKMNSGESIEFTLTD